MNETLVKKTASRASFAETRTFLRTPNIAEIQEQIEQVFQLLVANSAGWPTDLVITYNRAGGLVVSAEWDPNENRR